MSNSLNIPRVLISATGSGKGKTTVTTALLSLVKERNIDVHAAKCGPDYIDPMYHESVLGVPSINLDPYFCDNEMLRACFVNAAGDMNIIEGCMGLYDGLGTTSEKSPYEVAEALSAPIILIVDAYQKGYSIIPEISGFLNFDNSSLIKGIILNRISESYYEKIAKTIENETGVQVLGYMPKINEELFESRYLGLKSVEENKASEKIKKICEILKDTIDLDKVINIADGAKSLGFEKYIESYDYPDLNGMTIGIAKDAAFNFYYRDNIKALELSGAEVVYFSPLKDKYLPEDLDGLYLGGGYPELYAEQLSSNRIMLKDIKDFIEKGKPVFAECGGFMYLQKSIENIPMVGVFSDDTVNKGKLVRFGYVEAKYGDLIIRGHEFHHFDVNDTGNEMEITKASTGMKYKAFLRYKNCLAGFPHLYFMSQPKILEYIYKGKI